MKNFTNLFKHKTNPLWIRLLIMAFMVLAGVGNLSAAQYNIHWNGKVYFLAPETWNVDETYKYIQVDITRTTSATSSNHQEYIGNMTRLGTSRLFYVSVNANHNNWNQNEYIAFTANDHNYGSGSFSIDNNHYYTTPLDYGVKDGGYYLFKPNSKTELQTTTNANKITGIWASSRDDFKVDQTVQIYTNGSSSDTGGTVKLTGYYLSSDNALSSSSATSSSTSAKYGSVPGTEMKLTATAKTGYKFDGWYTAATGGTKLSSDATYTYNVYEETTVYARFSCATPTANKTINRVNYNGCDKVNVVLSGAINDPIYGMLVRYEGTKTSSQITAPTDGTTYNLNDEIGEGVVVAYGMTNASQFQNMPMPDVTTVYTFAYYEYHKNCKYYVLAGDLKTTELRTPTVTTADATNVNGANATLGGTYVKQGSGAGIEYYGIIWTEKPAGSTLQDINKAGSVGVGNSFTVDATFDVSGTYKYKAFINSNATGDCEIGYGEEKSITVSLCTRPVIVTNSATYNQSTGFVDINYSISETGGAITHYGIQYRAEGHAFPTQGLTNADFIKIGQTDNTVTNDTYTYQTVLTPGTYYFRTYANNGCPSWDYSVGMVYGDEIKVVVPKKDQPTTLILSGVDDIYCTVPVEDITLSTTGGDGEGAVSYQIVNDGTTATASITTNQLSITSAGTLNLKAIKAEDTNFNQAESDVVTVTIYADIKAGIISATPTTVCQGGKVTLTLIGHTADAKITWYADDAQVATDNATYTASNLQKATSYKVEVTRQDGSCDLKTKYTDAIQISVDQTSAITLYGNGEELCNGETIDLTKLESSNTGTVTWYSDETCTEVVAKPESITVNGDATYYAQAISGVCDAAKASYTITAKGVTISQSPATVHPYEVTTFTASKEATWELTANQAEGDDLSADDPVFSGKTTAYITKADGIKTTFKGQTATGYVIKATADGCETTHTFNVEDDPDNCKQ